jgi:chromosomal replication initiation ATPase DnaA
MVTATIEEKKQIDEIEKEVCKYFNVDKQSIVNNDRTSQVSMARGFIFYILHKDCGLSISKIANTYFRTSRAVFWHVNKVTFLLKQRMYKEIYSNICKE